VYRSFRRPGTPFDWSKVDPKALRERAEQLEAEQKKDQKMLNPKAVALIERCV
jgi:structural maintenance of chromosome 2